MPNLAVLCVFRESATYNVEYVNKLRMAINRNTTMEHMFIVLTDSSSIFDVKISTEICCVRHTDWNPKHNKLELFRPDILTLADRFFYFDLDTVITGNLDSLFNLNFPLVMLEDFYYNGTIFEGHHSQYGSGLMSWTRELGSSLYEKAARMPYEDLERKYPIGRGRGDQLFISQNTPIQPRTFQELLPGQVVSYRKNCRPIGGIPEDARVVCFHGKNNPRNVAENWFEPFWRI